MSANSKHSARYRVWGRSIHFHINVQAKLNPDMDFSNILQQSEELEKILQPLSNIKTNEEGLNKIGDMLDLVEKLIDDCVSFKIANMYELEARQKQTGKIPE